MAEDQEAKASRPHRIAVGLNPDETYPNFDLSDGTVTLCSLKYTRDLLKNGRKVFTGEEKGRSAILVDQDVYHKPGTGEGNPSVVQAVRAKRVAGLGYGYGICVDLPENRGAAAPWPKDSTTRFPGPVYFFPVPKDPLKGLKKCNASTLRAVEFPSIVEMLPKTVRNLLVLGKLTSVDYCVQDPGPSQDDDEEDPKKDPSRTVILRLANQDDKIRGLLSLLTGISDDQIVLEMKGKPFPNPTPFIPQDPLEGIVTSLIGIYGSALRTDKMQRDANANGDKKHEESMKEARDARLENRIMQAIFFYILARQNGMTRPIDRGLSIILRGLLAVVGGVVRWDFSDLRRIRREIVAEIRYRRIPTVLQVGTNLTELAASGEIRAAKDATTPQAAEKIERRIRSPRRAGSAVFEAPPGWGKEVLMRNLALRNADLVFIQTQPDSIMAGTMYRGTLEERITNIPKEIEKALKAGQRVILCIDEFHEAFFAGRNMEETRSLIERWKGPLANGTLRIVGFSTPDEMLKVKYAAGIYDRPESRRNLSQHERELLESWDQDPQLHNIRKNIELRALLNRFMGIRAPARDSSEIVVILKDELDYLRTHEKLDVRISEGGIHLIARLSGSDSAHEGYIPRTAFAIFDGMVAKLSENIDQGKAIHITEEEIRAYVTSDWPEIAQRNVWVFDPEVGQERAFLELQKASTQRLLEGQRDWVPEFSTLPEGVRQAVVERIVDSWNTGGIGSGEFPMTAKDLHRGALHEGFVEREYRRLASSNFEGLPRGRPPHEERRGPRRGRGIPGI